MKYPNNFIAVSQGLICTVLMSYSVISIAYQDIETMTKKTLLQQLTKDKKIKPKLYFENESLRLFGEKSSNLSREKTEILDALLIFDKNFGSTSRLDVALMNSQLHLMRLDSTQFNDNYFAFLSHQGQLSATKKVDINEEKLNKANILAHEVCHKLLINKVDEKGLRKKSNADETGRLGYGHSLLPDWFDEMAAVICENQYLKTDRLSDLTGDFIPFSQYLNMEHPVMAQQQEQIKALMAKMKQQLKQKSTEKKDDTHYVMVMDISEADESSRLAVKFYSQTALFSQFLEKKFGNNIFKTLTEKFVQGINVEHWIIKQLALKNTEQLDAMFKIYVMNYQV
ncbi:MAG: hypothetical protein JKY81_04215 [Colwellia sp.]|nr:hypothetical protein [Colwellia sp.]